MPSTTSYVEVARRQCQAVIHHRPLWLACFGPKRQVWAPKRIYEAYRQRCDREHMHRFLTHNLPATAYETSDTDHEERKKQASAPARALSPTHVQRDFQRILWQMGTPARRLQPGGKSKGRAPGQCLKRRPRYRIVRKGRKKAA